MKKLTILTLLINVIFIAVTFGIPLIYLVERSLASSFIAARLTSILNVLFPFIVLQTFLPIIFIALKTQIKKEGIEMKTPLLLFGMQVILLIITWFLKFRIYTLSTQL